MRLIFDTADEISLRLSDLRDQRAPFVAGSDPLELSPTYRAADDDRVAGGQGHTDADLDGNAAILLLPIGLAIAAVLGIACAELIARAATAAGAWWVS